MGNNSIFSSVKALTDDEKFRLLYRLELIELNKEIASVFARAKFPSDSYSRYRTNLIHSFFDGNTRNSERYSRLEKYMGESRFNFCDHLNTTGMYSFAFFLNEICDVYNDTKDYRYAVTRAKESNALFFNENDIKLYKDTSIINLKKLDKVERNKVVANIKEDLQINDLYHDINVYHKVNYATNNSKCMEETEEENALLYEQYLLDEQKRKELEDLRERNKDYYIPDEENEM